MIVLHGTNLDWSHEWIGSLDDGSGDWNGSITTGVVGTKTRLGIHQTGEARSSRAPIWRPSPKRMRGRKPPAANRRKILQL